MEQKYPLAIRILHWLMAIAILGLLVVGLIMADMEGADPLRVTLYNMHKSFGVLVLLLAAVRLAVRTTQTMPPLPEISTSLEKRLAKAMHHTLYLLMFAMPISGVLMSNFYGFPVNFFGVELPKVVGTNTDLAKIFGQAHECMAYFLMILIALHVGAVMKYLFISKYNILKRMV